MAVTVQNSYPFWGGEAAEQRAWDTCEIDGITIENVSVECPKERDIDVKKSKGSDGAKFSDNGYTPAKVTIKVQINTREEWNHWCGTVFPGLDPQKLGGLKKPLRIKHPEPNSRGITVIYITKIKGEPPSASKGKVETIEALHWVPEAKKTKSDVTAPKAQHATPAGPAPAQLFNNMAAKIEADSVAPNLPHNTFFDYTGGNGST
ncbi:MAG: hypothetical protein ABFD89_17715 [Bryobacteraceae bacterium]